MDSPYAGFSKAALAGITKAVGLRQGHWFECENGHPYVIGECGGAVQERKCSCGAPIGGGGHRLRHVHINC